MKIYENGLSIYREMAGLEQNKMSYVCVLDSPQDYTITEAFAEMVEFLKSEKSLTNFSIDLENHRIICNNGNSYTLATELLFKNGEFSFKPASIIRHCFTRLFTVESLYKNKEGEIIETVPKSLNDVGNNRLLFTNKDVDYNLNLFPDLLPLILEKILQYNCVIGSELERKVSFFRPIKHITNFEKIKELIEKYGAVAMTLFSRYASVKTYLFEHCGMELTCNFSLKELDVKEINLNEQNFDLDNLSIDLVDEHPVGIKINLKLQNLPQHGRPQ